MFKNQNKCLKTYNTYTQCLATKTVASVCLLFLLPFCLLAVVVRDVCFGGFVVGFVLFVCFVFLLLLGFLVFVGVFLCGG